MSKRSGSDDVGGSSSLINNHDSNGITIETGRGSTLGIEQDKRPTTLELSIWKDQDDDDLIFSSEEDETLINNLKRESDNNEDLHPNQNYHVDSLNHYAKNHIHNISKQNKSTFNASKNNVNNKSMKHLLQWTSGRRKWHSILELANVQVKSMIKESVMIKRRASTSFSVDPNEPPTWRGKYYSF